MASFRRRRCFASFQRFPNYVSTDDESSCKVAICNFVSGDGQSVSDPAGIQQIEIKGIITEALAQLYAENLRILQLDVAERTICTELKCILQRSFANHAVHTEYNKHGVLPKDIEPPNSQGTRRYWQAAHAAIRFLTRKVYPDIIVHQVGHDDENILVIEVKKSTNATPDHADLAKLKQIKKEIAYRYALFIRVSTGPDAELAKVRTIWV
jgi:hypothetical protein